MRVKKCKASRQISSKNSFVAHDIVFVKLVQCNRQVHGQPMPLLCARLMFPGYAVCGGSKLSLTHCPVSFAVTRGSLVRG